MSCAVTPKPADNTIPTSDTKPHSVILLVSLFLNSFRRPKTPNAPVDIRDTTFHVITKFIAFTLPPPMHKTEKPFKTKNSSQRSFALASTCAGIVCERWVLSSFFIILENLSVKTDKYASPRIEAGALLRSATRRPLSSTWSVMLVPTVPTSFARNVQTLHEESKNLFYAYQPK